MQFCKCLAFSSGIKSICNASDHTEVKLVQSVEFFFLLGLFLQGDLFVSSSTIIIFTDVADTPVALTVISTSAFLFSKEFSVLK